MNSNVTKSLSLNRTVSEWIQDGAKLFANLEGWKLLGGEITLYTVINFWHTLNFNAMNWFFFLLHQLHSVNWLHLFTKLWGIAKLPFFTGISNKPFHVKFALWINLTTQIVLHSLQHWESVAICELFLLSVISTAY